LHSWYVIIIIDQKRFLKQLTFLKEFREAFFEFLRFYCGGTVEEMVCILFKYNNKN
jgi:hypothetical protein